MKVRAKSCYLFVPSPIDVVHKVNQAHANQVVRVVNLPNAPKCNTMGQCYIETLDGKFLGMVATTSLRKLDGPPKRARKKKNAITP